MPDAKRSGIQRAVFITGCSVGVGHAAALLMHRNGWRVFAGVRKLADGESLVAESQGAITPVICDVRDRKQVFEASKQVAEQLDGAGLDGLVCNAGVGASGPVDRVFDLIRVDVEGRPPRSDPRPSRPRSV